MRRYNWVNVVFFALTPLVAVAGTAGLLASGGSSLLTWLLAGAFLLATGFSITGGYHRLYSHLSYQAAWPVRAFFILFGAAAFQGSARWWTMGHRHHHRFVDTEQDPYSIKKGFWYAHIGWLLAHHDQEDVYDNVADLAHDALVRWQARYYLPIAIFMGFALPSFLALAWGDFWGGFFVAGFLRMVILHHLTFFINSLCHTLGRQTYSDRHSGKDSWITALFTYGEGYHNYHHEFQHDYRNGIRSYHWDPTKWLINIFVGIGLASGLRRASAEKVLAARLKMEHKHATTRLLHCPEVVRLRAQALLNSTQERLRLAHDRLLLLQQEYTAAKRRRVDSVQGQLEQWRTEFRYAQAEFNQALAQWRLLLKAPLSLGA